MDYNILIRFAVAILLIVGEAYLSNKWYCLYFTKGIPVYRRILRLVHGGAKNLSGEALANHFRRVVSLSSMPPSLVFHELSSCDIAFREKILEITTWHFPPVMRGLIHLNHERSSLMIIGYLNWYIFLLYVLYLSIVFYVWNIAELSAMDLALFLILWPFLFFGFFYIWQIFLFNRVYNKVKQSVGVA